MNDSNVKSKRSKPASRGRAPIESAAMQPPTSDAWREFAEGLELALRGLEEDEFLVLNVKRTQRFVQFMGQGAFGMRIESVSNFYLPEGGQLGAADHEILVKLGWHAPTNLPDELGHKPDGSPNYYLDLAAPVPLRDVVILAVFTLTTVHGVSHPGNLEYFAASSSTNKSVRFPDLRIRWRE